jgi:hypothetical protein
MTQVRAAYLIGAAAGVLSYQGIGLPFAPLWLAQAVRLNKATAPISRSAPRNQQLSGPLALLLQIVCTNLLRRPKLIWTKLFETPLTMSLPASLTIPTCGTTCDAVATVAMVDKLFIEIELGFRLPPLRAGVVIDFLFPRRD